MPHMSGARFKSDGHRIQNLATFSRKMERLCQPTWKVPCISKTTSFHPDLISQLLSLCKKIFANMNHIIPWHGFFHNQRYEVYKIYIMKVQYGVATHIAVSSYQNQL